MVTCLAHYSHVYVMLIIDRYLFVFVVAVQNWVRESSGKDLPVCVASWDCTNDQECNGAKGFEICNLEAPNKLVYRCGYDC